MKRRLLPLLVLLSLLIAPMQAFAAPLDAVRAASLPGALGFDLVASGLTAPVAVTHAGDNSGRLFITQQTGQILIHDGAQLLSTPFLDISNKVAYGGERGLLSVAFHPNYETNGYFYVDYTRKSDGATARFHIRPDNLNRADPTSEEILLSVAQPYANHNGGQIAFGPSDGYLYIGMGDGGDGGDPHNYGQSSGVLLGKLLRIDVEGGVAPYGIPPTNPFTATAGYRGEIWALGLRNPWRFSFDRLTGDRYLGDVGQYAWEEIDFQAANSAGGENYGWRLTEGNHCFLPADCDPAGLTPPVAEYDHSLGCAVTGGHVYR